MKLIEIAEKIDKSEKNKDWINIEDIASDLNIEFYSHVEQDRLQAYWVGNWNCTDTWVGYKMYFLDDEPVGFSIQTGRKSDENFKWFSKELALKVRDYILSLMVEKNDELSFETCDINEDIGESFKIYYNDNILNPDKAMLNKEPVRIIERVRKVNDYGIDTRLKVEIKNGDILEVEIEDLDFGFNLKE